MRTCEFVKCDREYTPLKQNLLTQRFCSSRCRKRHEYWLETNGRRTGRCCRLCGADISDLTLHASRCRPCASPKSDLNRAKDRERKARAPRVVVVKPRVCAVGHCTIDITLLDPRRLYCDEHRGLRRKTDRPKKVRAVKPPAPPKEKPPVVVINTDGGPWFPGWNGCYSPNLSAFDIALIEKYFGPPPDLSVRPQ